MKKILTSAAMAFSMFSVLPMPMVEWKKENMGYMLCCLPLVGAVIGLALWGWGVLCGALQFGPVLYAAGLTLLPVILSGGIHLDGFCDTADALASHAPPERKREILKDSHTGAFAIIDTAAYFVLYFALCTEVPVGLILLLGLHQVLARALGALASVVFPAAGHQGLLATFRDAAQQKSAGILLLWTAACAVAMVWLAPVGGTVSLVMAAGCLGYVYHIQKREFGGMSGDLTGFFITLSTLAMVLGTVFAERMGAL